ADQQIAFGGSRVPASEPARHPAPEVDSQLDSAAPERLAARLRHRAGGHDQTAADTRSAKLNPRRAHPERISVALPRRFPAVGESELELEPLTGRRLLDLAEAFDHGHAPGEDR